MGLPGVFFAAGLTVSFAPTTRATSAVGHLEVRLVHLLELVVGHVGLGQQHVHMAGHAARHRVDGVEDVDSTRFESLGQLTRRMLRLGHGEAVAGDDDDLTGVGEEDPDVLRQCPLRTDRPSASRRLRWP